MMLNESLLAIPVRRECDVSRARRLATDLAGAMGFPRAAAYRLATTVSELGYNLVLHTPHGGMIRLHSLQSEGRCGIELAAEDDGPGIPDLALAMSDGYSTNHGLGSGLPGSRRLMDEFQILSTPGEGTRVTARLWR
jgi:serine/threonine-protein kinase RsbT